MTSEVPTLAAPVAAPDPHGVATAIDVEDATRSFGPVRALDGISLRVRSGETVALLGPNGAGKTTLITVMLGLQRPDLGRVLLFGAPPSRAVAQGRVGAMLQDGGLMPGVRVDEMLRLLHRLYPHPMSVAEAGALAQVEGFMRQRVDRLSAGQTQRVRVAAALIGDPELLILDEPTSAMDVEARRRFWRGMDGQAARGKTILFSTHILDEADAHCDRVVVVGRGRILADGTPAAIKATVGLRSLRFTTTVSQAADRLRALPGVSSVAVRGDRVEVLSSDSDAALRAALARDPGAHDIEVAGLDLEDAFLALTRTDADAQDRERVA